MVACPKIPRVRAAPMAEEEESEELLEDEELQDLDDFLQDEQAPEERYSDGGGQGDDPEERHLPSGSPTSQRLDGPTHSRGKNGPRTPSEQGSRTGSEGRQMAARSRDSRDSRGSRGPGGRAGVGSPSKASESQSLRRPRGNLPPAPSFDGNRRKDPRCFRKYANKVDSYVAIAEKIIDQEEIGLRLHAALEGEAADYLEDVPAKVFGEKDGWQVLLKVLREKYDETRMAKVGTAMKEFFQLQTTGEKAMSMREIAEYMDKSSRQCRDAGLEIPDAVMVYFFFQHTHSSTERQANLLLRTEGEYNWKKMKKAVDLLYPNVVVRQATSGGKGYRGRGAHEVHQSDQWTADWSVPDLSDPQVSWEDWLYENDPVEAIVEHTVHDYANAVVLPENLAQELHSCFATHRENRQKLAKAVQARGYYVKGKGKGKSKGKKGGKGGFKGKTKGGKGAKGKARGGLTLEELKAQTACTNCDEIGHWHDDCPHPPRRANVTHQQGADGGNDDEAYGEWDYDAGNYYEEWDDAAWDEWSPTGATGETRSTHAANRFSVFPLNSGPSSTSRPTASTTSLTRPSARPTPTSRTLRTVDEEAEETARTINKLKSSPASTSKPTVKPRDVEVVRHAIMTDDFVGGSDSYQKVKGILETRNVSKSSASASKEAVEEARGSKDQAFDEIGSVWSLLQKSNEATPELDSLRIRRPFMSRRVPYDDDESRSALSTARRVPTVQDGKLYLTIDTACENTVVGTNYVQGLLETLKENGLMPLQEPEAEKYCFGPGEPKLSTVRLSVPIGLGGTPCIIRTSVIPEQPGAPNSIPFLAGQDWLLMMKAVIDIGNNEIYFPEIDKQVPIYVDVSGHLVVEIDNYPDDGWPPGLQTRVDEYPGAVFTIRRVQRVQKSVKIADGAFVESEKKKGQLGSVQQAVQLSPNSYYEPNDDDMNTHLTRGPCSVQADYWEFLPSGVVVRHHCRPRTSLFQVDEAQDGPDPQSLRKDRVTVRWGQAVHHDVLGQQPREMFPWVGMTCFFLSHADPNETTIPSCVHDGVKVTFLDGSIGYVSAKSISPLKNKKIHHFDVTSKNAVFEHAATVKRGDFVIPSQQFGSRTVVERRRDLLQGDAQATTTPEAQQGPPPSSMVSLGGKDPVHVERGKQVAHRQQDDQGDEAQVTSSHGIRRGNVDQREREHDSGNFATLDDSSSGTDCKGPDGTLPRTLAEVSTRTGVCQETRECPREIPGVHSMRLGDEGLRGGLCDPNFQGDSPHLRHSTRDSFQAGRKSKSNGQRRSSILSQLGKVLLALIATSFTHAGEVQPISQESTIFGSPIEEPPENAFYTNFEIGSNIRVGDRHGQEQRRGDVARFKEELTTRHLLKNGWKKRIRHSARKALMSSRASQELVRSKVADSKWPKKNFRYDLVEIFGGSSMISIRAVKGWGLKVIQPIDIRYGINLRHRRARRWMLQTLDRMNPRLAIVEFPCTPWSILQRNCNYRDDPQGLFERQEADRPFLKLTEDIFESQRKRQGHALAENPATAESHNQPEIRRLRERYWETTSCMCQFGMVGKRGLPMMKRVRWIATHPLFVERLDRQCDRQHQHEKVEGSNTSLSAQYPPDLADEIVRTYLEVCREEDFGLAHDWSCLETRNVHYVDVNRAEDSWRPLLAQAEEVLARRVQSNCFIDPSSDLYKKIMKLVPWQIENIQISHLPKAKRIRPGLEQCHRCSVLLQNDNQIIIETEHLPSAQAPRERFIAPVKIGIFVLGHAPGEPKEPSPVQAPSKQYVPQGEVVHDPLEEPVRESLQKEGLVRQDFASGECWFIGPPLRHEERRIATSLVRMHRNLGHPRQEDFTRALAQHGKVDPEAVALSRRLRCASCERTRRPLPPRPTSLKAVGAFNDRVCLDFVFLHDATEVKHNFLHILDPAGGFNVFAWIPSRQPAVVLETFMSSWSNWAGFPRKLWVDRDGGFEAEFLEKVRNVGVELDTNAAEAHWQVGEVEAYNRAFRYVAEKIIDEKQLSGEEDMKMMASTISSSMNDKIRTCGASANQWLFGRNPRVPADLLSPDGQIEALYGLEHDEELRRRNYVRAQADVALSQFRIDDALRKAVLRQGRPARQHYEPGELVAFWRNVKKRKGKVLQPGWFRGTIVGPYKGVDGPSQSNYWVTSAGKLILVSKEQLRPTYGTERWRIQEQDLEGVLDNTPDHYHDEVGDGPPEDMRIEEEVVVPLYEEQEEPAGSDYSASIAPAEDPGVLEEEKKQSEAEASVARVSDTTQPHVDSPLHTRAPGTPVHNLSEAAERGRLHPVDSPRLSGLRDDGPDLVEPEAKRLRLDDEDFSMPMEYPNPAEIPTVDTEVFAQAHGALYGCRFNGVRQVCATRKDQKALEKEIPWHLIPEEERPGYEEALSKEWDTWKKYDATRTLSKEASEFVEQHVDPSRILKTRVCYRNKNAAYPWMPVKHKARIVCRGDMDPDLVTLRRDAPTVTRLGLMVVLQISASMPGWFLFNSDITGAFLQGDQGAASRKEPLYLRQPREGLPGLQAGQLLLVVRGIFGLANSPRLFWRHLRDSLLRLGFVQSTLDRALFMYYKNEKLILVLGAHVDDLIGTGEPESADVVLQQLRDTFDFGAWADSRTDKVLEYGGKQITKEDGVVKLSQKNFIKAATITPIPKWRTSTPNATLTSREMTELRSAGGCLHWMVGQTRPDLAAGTSLSMSGTPTVQSLVQLNRLLKEAKSSEDWGLTFQPIPLESARFVVYSDSSWANAAELKSQAGFMVFIAGEGVNSTDGDRASLLDWRSHRIKRQCRSTLAAETMAMDAAMDAGLFARELMAEVMIPSYVPLQAGRLPGEFLPVVAVTDCRSLYDLLVKDGPLSSTQEKRLAIDIGGLKESAGEFDPEQERLAEVFHWVATESQVADHLTKMKPPELLRSVLDQGFLALKVESPD